MAPSDALHDADRLPPLWTALTEATAPGGCVSGVGGLAGDELVQPLSPALFTARTLMT